MIPITGRHDRDDDEGVMGMNMFDIEGIPVALNGSKVCQDDAIRTNNKKPPMTYKLCGDSSNRKIELFKKKVGMD